MLTDRLRRRIRENTAKEAVPKLLKCEKKKILDPTCKGNIENVELSTR